MISAAAPKGFCIRLREYASSIWDRVGGNPARPAITSSILMLLLMCAATSAHAHTQGVRVIVVAVDYISMRDLQSAGPSVGKITASGSSALVNTGILKDDSLVQRRLALGSGNRPDSRKRITPMFFDSEEMVNNSTAGRIYAFNTGRNPPRNSVVCINYAAILREYGGSSSLNIVDIGLLGDAFHDAGMRTAAVGNSDTPEGISRIAPLIASDGYGYIDSGDVGSGVTRREPDSPCGIADDIGAMTARVGQYASGHGLIVVHPGDLSRLEDYRPRLSDEAYQMYRKQALGNLDRLIGYLISIADVRNASLMLISSCRNRAADERYSNLAPVVLYKRGAVQSLLTSDSTRATGLISNIDIAPTIMSAAGLQVSDSILGRPAHVIPSAGTIDHLVGMEEAAAAGYAIRVPALIIIAIFALLTVTLCEYALRRREIKNRPRRILHIAAMALIGLPSAMLMVDWAGAASIPVYFGLLITAIAILLAVSYMVSWVVSQVAVIRLGDRNRAMLVSLLLVTALLILADAASGARLLRWSILSCDYITGIRYYGIGNEYMGFLVGMALMIPLLALRKSDSVDHSAGFRHLSRRTTVALIAWFALITAIIGFPGIGANVGGLLTAIAAFSAAGIVISGVRLDYRHGIIVSMLAVVAITVFAAIDISNANHGASHLGRSLAIARSSGFGAIMSLLTHKIAMHVGIIISPEVYYPMIFGIPFLVMYGARHGTAAADLSQTDITRGPALPIIITGMSVAFLFNDSGIVPAAMLLAVYAVSSIILRLGGRL